MQNLPQFLFQICTIDLAVGPLDNATVALTPGQLNIEQDPNMAIFHITHWSLDSKSKRKGSLRRSLTLQRKVTSELMTTYFPSLLLIAITFATTFFKPDFFEAGLSVNLTNMLVMTTIFISKMEGLPPTSDIKMIDIWLILCQLVPYTQVVLLTAMEFLREGEKEKDKQAEPEKPKQQAKDEAKPKNAWILQKPGHSSIIIVQMLAFIGKFFALLLPGFKRFLFSREKGCAHCCIAGVYHLLWICWNLLFSIVL